MSTRRPKSSSRERIMDAAEHVVREKGASHMTMDAVAAKAGVSKGGLIYHFPSQRDLLKAMLKRFIDHVEARMAKARATLPASPVREIKAYVTAWFSLGGKCRRTASALLATITREPELLNTLHKKHFETIAKIVEAAPSRERVTILSLATEGMWMSELLNISPFTNSERGRIKRALLRLADEWYRPPAMGSPPKGSRRQGKSTRKGKPRISQRGLQP